METDGLLATVFPDGLDNDGADGGCAEGDDEGSGELAVKLDGLCTVLFVDTGGAAVVGGGATETAGCGAGGGTGIFRQGCSISMLGPGTSEQRVNEVTMPNIGRPPK